MEIIEPKKKTKTKSKKEERRNNQKTKFKNGNKYMSINNYLKCQWTECSNQKTQSGRLHKKAKTYNLLSTRDSP